MPTIAELQIEVDSTPLERATKGLTDFASAASQAAKSGKDFSKETGSGGGIAPQAETTKVKNLTEAIDAQARKLSDLAEKRKKLENSGLKTSEPEQYKKLNAEIDANIALVTRRGNAVDALNIKQGQDFVKAESRATAEAKAQEKLVRQTEAQARAVSTAASQQNAQIDATIAGLDKQVKAQLQYNKTIEELNKARALSGMGGTGDQSRLLSDAEYNHWVKVADARRNAALALDVNDKAVDRQQSKLDSLTASLGKVERAEIAYGRGVTTLNDSLKMGLVTTEQYDAKLASITNRRDQAIKAANDNTQAEQRFASQLQSVVAAYDPVQRAQDTYNSSVRVLAQGLQEGKISADTFNKALTEQRAALDGVRDASKGINNLSSQYEDALGKLVPYRTELKNLEQQEKILQSQKAAGKVQTSQQIADYDQATAAIHRQRKEYEKRIEAGKAAGITFKQEQAAMRGLPAQFTDIVVSLQGGQAPLTVLLQQGGQIKDMFGGIVPALSAMGKGLVALLSPATIAAAAIALIGYNAYQGSQEINEFNKAVAQSGGFSGTSASQYSVYRDAIAGVTGNAAKAADALAMMEKSGKIAGEQFVKIGIAAIDMQKATGQSIQQTVDDFASLAKDPVAAVLALDDKYKGLTASVLTQIDALVKQGDIQGAVILGQNEMSKAAEDMSKKMIENLGYAERAWNSLKEAVSDTASAIASIGRQRTAGDELSSLQMGLAASEKSLREGNMFTGPQSEEQIANNGAIKVAKERIKQLQMVVDLENHAADVQREAEVSRQRAVTSQNRINTGASAAGTAVEKVKKELEKAAEDYQNVFNDAASRGETLTAKQVENYAKYKGDLDRKLKEALETEAKKGAGKSSPAQTQQLQEVKSDLTLIQAEYAGHYKKVTALGEADLVSKAATFASQKAILAAEAKAVSESYDKQIDELEKLQGKKSNTAAANVSLDNQLIKAQASKLKAEEDYNTKQSVLATKEKGYYDTRTASIEAYNEAIRQQVDNTKAQGQRAVAAVGRGDRQGQLNEDLADLDRQFAKDRSSLAKQQKGMDPEEYAQKLKILKDAHTEMKDVIVQNDVEIQAANADWTNGFSKALENLADEANNMAGAVNTAVSGAFDSMGNALGEFVVTGKGSFKELTISIISDMARIAAQQAASGALSALFGAASTLAGAYFGGGNGLSGAAGASSNLGASQAGYNNLSGFSIAQAKGGGWTGGTQFFAQGGAFTNSVVSSPTAFGMSGGGRGVMGEAGPEAIVPLARASDGSLGVRMMGAGGSGKSGGVQVFVSIASDGSVTSTTDEPGLQQFGSELGAFVDQRWNVLTAQSLKDGGSIKNAIKAG